MQHYHIRAKDRDGSSHGALVETWEDAQTEREIEMRGAPGRAVNIEPCTKDCFRRVN